MAIDDTIAKKPKNFEALLQLLRDDGYEVKLRGKDISIRGKGKKGFIRLAALVNFISTWLYFICH